MENLLNMEISYFVLKECSPSWNLKKRELPFYDLVIILDGSADYIVDGEAYHVVKGDVLLIPPGSSRNATSNGMTCAAFDFTPGQGVVELPILSHGIQTSELLHWLHEFNSEWLQKNEGYMVKCGALFLLILHKITYGHGASTPNLHVEKIKRYIVEHLAESLTVSKLAGVAGINPIYCGALFKRVQNCSISQYISRVRVNNAAALLEKDENNIGEVAYKTGFNDIYHFSSTFKKLVGVSPSEYKKQQDRRTLYGGGVFTFNPAFLQD